MAATGERTPELTAETWPPERPAPRRSAARLGYVRLIAFVVGSASLGAEIAAARLLAPYFGASTVIWANTIATVLVALSIGYAAGGRLADRWPHVRGLCTVVLLAGLALAAVPFAADPFLHLAAHALGAVSVGGFVGSLVAVLGLVAIPVALLGCVAPFANRIAVARLTATGTVTGRLYAISTVGSLVGTFVCALLLIPLIGTHRTFLVFAFALVAVAAPGLGRRRLLAVVPAVAALLAIPPAPLRSGTPGARVIYSAETQYQTVRVLQLPTGERWLELNEGVAVHSDYKPWSYLTGGYWDDFLVLPQLTGRGTPRRIAILGDAAGTVARAYGHFFPRTRVDAVELDGALTALGRRYFGLGGPNLHTYTADARPWLAASPAHYDAIFLDAYRQPYIPFYLVTREFFAAVAQRLNPRGLVIVNVGHTPGSDALEKVVTATLRADFPYVARDAVGATNSLVLAGEAPIRIGHAGVPTDLQITASVVASRTGPGLGGGTVYTDDRAPVEWLTDLSLLQYAAGTR